jgi:hypothetical protein
MEHVLQLLVRDLVFWDYDLENSRLVELQTYNGEALVLVLDDSSTSCKYCSNSLTFFSVAVCGGSGALTIVS